MQLTTMRKIDSLIGRPVCFFCTLFHKLVSLVKKPSDPASKPVKKILLIKLSEMGALVLTFPLLTYLKEKYPDASISFLVFEKNASAIKLLKGTIDDKNIFSIKDESLIALLLSTLGTITKIRKENFDIAIDLEFFSRFTSLLIYFSGATKKAGFYRFHFEGLYRGDLLTHKIQYNPLIHCSRSYLSLAKTLALPYIDNPPIPEQISEKEMVFPHFDPVAEDIEAIRARLLALKAPFKHIYLINPGDGILPLREWPLENFIKISKRILQNEENMIIIIGKDNINDKDTQLHSALNSPRCINLVNKTSMKELLALFHISQVMITNDCGLPHLASLTPLKKLVIFGPESPSIFAPVGKNTHIIYSNYPCSPCLSALNHRDSSCQDNQCVKIITVDQVYNLIT